MILSLRELYWLIEHFEFDFLNTNINVQNDKIDISDASKRIVVCPNDESSDVESMFDLKHKILKIYNPEASSYITIDFDEYVQINDDFMPAKPISFEEFYNLCLSFEWHESVNDTVITKVRYETEEKVENAATSSNLTLNKLILVRKIYDKLTKMFRGF